MRSRNQQYAQPKKQEKALCNRRGQGNRNRGRQNRQDDRNARSLSYSIRYIPTFDGKGDAMPHIYFIKFEDFLINTGSEINELPQHGEPQAVDRPHYEAVIRNVTSKSKASLKRNLDFGLKCNTPM